MTLVVCWLAYPLLLGLLALGCGLLVERAAGIAIPGTLLLPAGLAVIAVVGSFTTMTDATAELTVPAVIVPAVAGLAWSQPWRRNPDLWALGCAAGVFAVFALPIILSGEATFAGYHSLDDTAVWLALEDYAFDHGRSLPSIDSGHTEIVGTYLDTGYPLGAFVPLGVGRILLGQDAAWLFQPYLAFTAAMLALGLYTLTAPLIESSRIRALIAFISAQPALLFAFSLWSGIKEMTLVSIIALTAALIGPTLRGDGGVRSFLPLALGSAAVLAVMSLAGGVWLLLTVAVTFGLAINVRGEIALRQLGTFSALAAALSIPALVTAFDFVGPAGNVLTSGLEVGRLNQGPLSVFQAFGIWPSGDFRLDPQAEGLAYLLIAIVGAAAVAGLVWAGTRRAWAPLTYVGTTVVGSLVLVSFGSPWMDAKAFAISSPALLLAGLLGAAWLLDGARREAAAIVALVIAGGVIWSNVLAYLHVPLAPRDRLVEFDRIDDRFAGQGPTLVNEDDPYAILYFLRNANGYGPSYGPAAAPRLPATRRKPAPMTYTDLDQFVAGDLLYFRTIVLRRSPTASRPPSTFKLAWTGRYFEVWQRPAKRTQRIVAHVPLGNVFQPSFVPKCRDVTKLARRARGGRVVAVRRSPPLLLALGQAPDHGGWKESLRDPTVLTPAGSASLEFDFLVTPAGRYEVSIRGSFQPRLRVWIDGELIDSARQQLNYVGQYADLGEVDLTAGRHRIKIEHGGADLHPGSAARGSPLGPLVLARKDTESLVTVPPQRARSLCGKTLDWIEAVRS